MKTDFIKLNGLVVYVYASKVDKNTIVVDIDSSDLEEKFQCPNGIPRLRVFVNEKESNVKESGGWEVK